MKRTEFRKEEHSDYPTELAAPMDALIKDLSSELAEMEAEENINRTFRRGKHNRIRYYIVEIHVRRGRRQS